jgi:hypothetical protein
MKKLLLILGILTACVSYAQLEKGAKLVGLQTHLLANDMYNTHWGISFGSSGYDLGFNIVPTFGYALQRNWLIGAHTTFGIESIQYKGYGAGYDHTDTYIDLGFAPFTRLYLDLSRNKKWKLFGVAGYEIVYTTTKNYYPQGSFASTTHSNKTSGMGSLGGGFAYFGRKLIVDASMSNTALRLGFYRVLPSRKK